MGGVQCAVEKYVNSMAELQTTMDNFQKTILAEVSRLVEYQSSCLSNGKSLHAHNGPWYAPDDPTLPQPWKGLVDGSSGSMYYWNTETNATQYEKPTPASFLPIDPYNCVSAQFFPNTNYHRNSSLTHPTLPHHSHQIPPFTTSAHPTHSDYGYLYPPPYLANQLYPCDPYPNTLHSSPCPSANYPESHMLDNYVMKSSSLTPPPSSAAFIACGGFNIEKMDHSKVSKLKLQLIRAHYNLKPRSLVPMKRKRQLTLSHRRPSHLSKGLKWEKWGVCCKAPSIVPTTPDLVLPSNMLLDSISPPMVLDVISRQDFNSLPCMDGSMFTLGMKTIVTGTEGFTKFSEGNCSYPSNGPSCQPHSLANESLTDLGKMPEEKEQSAIAHHFCYLVVDINNFSKVTNLFSGLKPISLSMRLVEAPVCLEVSILVSYEHGSKHKAVEFIKFMVCSFTIIELIETLRVAHLAHLQATLSDWKVREKNVFSSSKGGFEYDVHLENLIESLTRNSQKLFVNIHVKGIESKCSVMFHWLPSLNWNFQQGVSYLGKCIVCLNYHLCFTAEMHFLGLITSIVQLGLETSMPTSSHAWDLQFHKLQTRWITTVNTFPATLSHGLNTRSLMVVLSIHSGIIDLPSLVIPSGHCEVITSCHLLGGEYFDHAWLYFLTNKDQGVKVILISMENLVQCLSFMFNLNSKNKVTVIFIINQPLIVQQMFYLRFDTAMICLLLPFVKLVLIICGMTCKNLDRIALPSALWSTPICKDIVQLQLHGAVIIEFLLGAVSNHIRSDTNTLRYFSGLHSSLASINMKLQVYPIPYDFGLQKHGHELDYFFMACTVLALFLLVATMFIKDVNEGNLYLIEVVVVIHAVLFCQLQRFFVEVIDSLQVNSEFFPMRYSSGQIVLFPTMDIQSVMYIIFQDGLLMTHEHGRGIDESNLLIPPLLALGVRWFIVKCFLNQLLAILFGDTSTILESLCVNSVTMVTLKYKKETLDVIFPTAIFYVAFLFFSLLQLLEKFRPNQLVKSSRYSMTKQELLAIFCLWRPTALSSSRDWVFILHGLIVIWAHVLIGNTIFLGELKFDHESHITPNRTMPTGRVFPLGENSQGALFQYGCSTPKNDTKLMLSKCLTFYGGALSRNAIVMISVDQLTSKSTTQTLWLDATAETSLIVNSEDVVVQSCILILSTFKFICTFAMSNQNVDADDMIEEVRGKVTIHVVISFLLLTNGSCGCWNAKEATVRDFDAQMWGEGIQSTVNLPTEDLSTVAGQTNTTWMQLEDNWFNYSPTTMSRHEDMPSFKRGGMIGSLGEEG